MPPRGSRRPRSDRCRRCLSGGAAAGAGVVACRSRQRTPRAGEGARLRAPGVATISSSATASAGSSFAQARCLVPNSRSRSSRPSVQPNQHPRGPVFRRRPFLEHFQPSRRHQVNQQRQIPKLDHRHLPDPPHPGHLPPDQRVQAAAQRSSSRSSPAPGPIRPQLPTRLAFSLRATISTSGNSGMEEVCRPREAGVGRVRERSQFAPPAGPSQGRPRKPYAVDLFHVHSTGSRQTPAQRTSRKGRAHAGAPDDPTHRTGRAIARRDRCSQRGGSRARRPAQRRHPRPQLRAAGDPGRRRPHGRLARALAPGGGHRRRGDRLLRRPLHGRDRLDPLAREDGADPRPRRRLLAGRLDRRRPAARLEGRASRRPGRHVRQHLGRGQGRDRLLLHLLQRGEGRRADLGRARRRHRDPLRPRHVARRLRRARDRPGRRTASGAAASTSGTASATSTPASGPTTSPGPGPSTPRPSS